MADLRSHERGELAYNAYRETTGGKTWNNSPCRCGPTCLPLSRTLGTAPPPPCAVMR